ncbi:hypothetical protein BEP19_09570 [Ammoniphilus oxalaticus]|uniref:ATP-grasp domain-containing protein n=1 Tax=Ammoniphilus oxalaticus TaxID=66863 RepID=A0A419SKS6_9BACL|nr:YheC/YheD family protein [Ammoniphilus oxalaticus]RKD24613.1 hypothetical protein BEP19_09570 [Ammoniphilus oxalaticus]
MIKRRYQYVMSKWEKDNLLQEHEIIQSYMPEMKWLTKENLIEMLTDHPVLYMKPDTGMKGRGIIQLSHAPLGFVVRSSDSTEHIHTFDSLTVYLKSLVKNYKYIIQEGIPLLTLNEQPIDFRVLAQRPMEQWVYSGIVGKLGAKNGIITNFASGGKAISFRQAMMETMQLPFTEIKRRRDELRDLSLVIADHLTNTYPGLRELGIDYGIDIHGNAWIIEVNTTPGHQLFKALPNENIYRRIVRNFRLLNRH